ncbi:selenium cofactor biosynthesis protein YqeC [Sporomusa sp.]|uniref:selenium cofactor biosynthesis protein YqeC n=1 Tax=Sporomusa sp. TaxID=2078658 RepID=UPI002C18D15A|nr:selenium cofactor biosynthesis protein YqeC [Sporomusa sp.]HWR41684.1 selenium cofactor biosynthesis protein YqeC [Sporomusa sp.]
MLWDALGVSQPGVTACVGAGGKTSLIQSLATRASIRGWPVLVTATTKMFYRQVAGYELVLADDAAVGVAQVVKALQTGKPAAWFARQDGEKVIGVPSGWVDSVAASAPNTYILVEADGARRSLIKAPAEQEPVIPDRTTTTVGVLNLGAVGQPLSEANTHRLDLVSDIINKQVGETLEWLDLARLAAHRQGIFQYAQGTRILLLSGAEGPAARVAAEKISGYSTLARAGVARVIVTEGYGCAMQPCEVYKL